MRKQSSFLAVLLSCVLVFAVPMNALCSEAASMGDTSASAETEFAAVVEEEPETEAEVPGDETGGEETAVAEETTEAGTAEAAEEVETAENTPAEEETAAVENADTEPAEDEAGNDGGSSAGEDEAAAETTGKCGDNLTWEYIEADKALYIKGEGAMFDYNAENLPGWDSYKENIESLHIEKDLTLLDGDAFAGMIALDAVYYGGSEKDWAELEYAGDQQKEDVFKNVLKYYFEGNPEEKTAEKNTKTDQMGAVASADGLAFVTEPSDISVKAGSSVTFSVEVNKTDVYYQWQWSKDGSAWNNCASAGSDTDTFSFVMKSMFDGRYYRCIVADDSDEIISNAAQVTVAVDEALKIITQPKDVKAAEGEQVTFTVAANKADATYQWQWSKDGSTWRNCTSGGFNTNTFSFAMKATLDGRKYRCVVTSGSESLESDAAQAVFAEEALVIITQPQDVEAALGETVSFTVGANKADATYQWQWSKNGSTWANCTSGGYNTDTFSFKMKTTMSGRQYRCIVTSGSESLESYAALVTLPVDDPLEITKQPEDAEAKAGEYVSFKVGANKTDASYQWQWSKNGTTWTNCASGSYNTDTFGFTMKALFDGRMYRCIVSCGSESLESDAARATIPVSEPLKITRQPASVKAAVGDPVSLHVEANLANVAYQWQWSKNGTTWTNCTSGGCKTDTFSFAMKETMANRQYRCIVTLGDDSVTSEIALIELEPSTFTIDGVIYELIDNVMTVTGYTGSSATVTVREEVDGHTVTVIGESAFEGNTTLQQIDLPDTIEVIGRRAFADCTSLTKMN